MKHTRQIEMLRQLIASNLYDAMVQSDLVPGELAHMCGVSEKRIRSVLKAEHKNTGDITISEISSMFNAMNKSLDVGFSAANTAYSVNRPTELGGQLGLLDFIAGAADAD